MGEHGELECVKAGKCRKIRGTLEFCRTSLDISHAENFKLQWIKVIGLRMTNPRFVKCCRTMQRKSRNMVSVRTRGQPVY